ncbi:MAG: hypothetical protein AAGB29_11085 [Planctomycetota bacterium]
MSEPGQVKWYRSWVRVPSFILFWTFVLSLALWLPVIMLLAAANVGSFGQTLSLFIFGAIFVLSFAGFILWGCWIAPVLKAGSLRHLYWGDRTPRILARGLGFSAFMPVVWLFFVSLYCLYVWEGLLKTPDMPPTPYFEWLVVTGLLAFGATCIAIPLRIWVVRRFRSTLKKAQICFECGYQLYDAPGPDCPECGEPIPASPS